jgi:hypothetical protein
MQFQARTGPIQNNAASFSPEMAQGSAPHKSRASSGPRIGLPSFIDVPTFAFESILGSRLDSRNHLTYPQHVPTKIYPHQAAAFSTEMAAGVQGQTWPSPRILLGPKIPQPIAQTTHVDAAFSAEMVAGVTVPKPRITVGRQIGPPLFIYVDAFAFDSVLASQLDARNHLTRPQHVPPLAQTTHVAAAFSQDMVAGWQPGQPRVLRPRQIGLPEWAFVQTFAFESVLDICLDSRNHLTRPHHLPAIYQSTHTAAPFSIEMVSRAIDGRARLRATRQQAGGGDLIFLLPFDFESVLSLCLDNRNHLRNPIHLPPIAQPLHVAAAFSEEMTAGAQGVVFPSPRLHAAPRIPLPLAQPTHVSASSVTPEMWTGWISIPPQLKNTGLFVFYTTTGENLGVASAIGVFPGINNPGAISEDVLREVLGSTPRRSVTGRSPVRGVKKTP